MIIIPDIANFVFSSRISESDYKLLLTEGAKYGLTIAFVGAYSDLIGSYDINAKNTKAMVE